MSIIARQKGISMAKLYDDHSTLNAKILSGVTKLANNVKTTMGPRGRNVILHQKGKNPIVTKDGVVLHDLLTLKIRLRMSEHKL